MSLNKYIVLGDPIPLARARMSHRRIYDSQKQEKLVWGLVLTNQHDNRPLFSGPLHLDIDFYLPLPTMPKRRELLRGTFHVYKPDLSNMIKFVEDVSTGILFHDDCIIASLSCKKLYDEQPRTEFVIKKL